MRFPQADDRVRGPTGAHFRSLLAHLVTEPGTIGVTPAGFLLPQVGAAATSPSVSLGIRNR